MKFTTFIKAYKIALSNISGKVSDWKSVYLGDTIFPDDDNMLRFIFTNGYNMQPGDLGISASLDISSVEKFDGGLTTIQQMTMNSLDKDVLAREYINHKEKINEAGRVLVLLETLLLRLQTMYSDTWESAEINSLWFNFDKDIAEFNIDNTNVYTNGCLVLFGD